VIAPAIAALRTGSEKLIELVPLLGERRSLRPIGPHRDAASVTADNVRNSRSVQARASACLRGAGWAAEDIWIGALGSHRAWRVPGMAP
jgi:hypothetical protein